MRRLAVVLALTAALVGLAAGFSRPGRAAPNQFVTMSDGTRIAVNVRLPEGHEPGRRYPTVLEMSGYDGGSASGGTLMADLAGATGLSQLPAQQDSRQLTRVFDERYVTVHASVRGTGCSSGEFDLFSWRSALDGRELIDDFIARQSWSNGDVAVMGHSYGGITGFMVAATRPAHLRAVTVSGLIDDLYRGAVRPGGVANYGFPAAWAGVVRPGLDLGGGLLPGVVRPERPDDPAGRRFSCVGSAAGRSRALGDDPLIRGLSETDGPWYRSRSLVGHAGRITVPIHVTGTWQDEATGPRGFSHLWEKVEGVPKRLLVANGTHATNHGTEAMADRMRWVDHWLLGDDAGHGTLGEGRSSVTTLLEVAGGRPNGRKESTSFPLEDSRWTDWYLRAGGGLSLRPPTPAEPADRYLSTVVGRPSHVGPTEGRDRLAYRSGPFPRHTAVVGPATATLYAATTAHDTDLFVELADLAPDGRRSRLQKGLLRASHRALQRSRSDRTPDGRVYRPYHPHTDPSAVAPGTVEEYVVEVFPVGHVFRAGHRLEMVVSAPPAVDGLDLYAAQQLPALTTLFHDATHPSRLLLALVPLDGVDLGPPRACGEQDGVRCAAGSWGGAGQQGSD